MKRIYISGLSWQLNNQPCLILVTEKTDFLVTFPCDPIEISALFKIARREPQQKMPLLASSTAKFLAQTYVSITSIELVERKESSDRAIVNVLTNDNLIKAIEMTCLEAITMGLIFDRPMFAAESLLQPMESVVPELSKAKKEQESQEIAKFIDTVKASDFTKFADSKQIGL